MGASIYGIMHVIFWVKPPSVNYLKGKNNYGLLLLGCTPRLIRLSPQTLNIMPGDKVRLLIPEDSRWRLSIIGGTRDYGRGRNPVGAAHDVYVLLALWNSPTLRSILQGLTVFIYRPAYCS